MKTKNSIYIFFIVSALLFWNPLSYYLLYRNTPVYVMKAITWFYRGFFSGGILLIFLIQINKLHEKLKSFTSSVAVAAILLAFIILINSLLGGISKKGPEGLIFPPNTSAHYRSSEFDCMAKINSLGLRDREIPVNKGSKFRILCFGDSWTFGWGVNVENSWPKKLEQFFSKNGYPDIEVINCGKPGDYTTRYKEYIKKVVPVLKPDLVLIGVLELDDLAQLYENNYGIADHRYLGNDHISVSEKIRYVLSVYINVSFHNILSVFSKKGQTEEIQPEWKETANNMFEKFGHLEALRFYALDDSVQILFKKGGLNPGLVEYYIDFPDRITIFNDPHNTATKFATSEMNKDVGEMKSICEENKCHLIFVNLPFNEFNGQKVIRTPLDDIMAPYFEKNNKIDSIYNSVASVNKIPYIELTKHFDSLQNKTGYYFLYDGHPTPNGQEEIADYIGNQLIRQNLLK